MPEDCVVCHCNHWRWDAANQEWNCIVCGRSNLVVTGRIVHPETGGEFQVELELDKDHPLFKTRSEDLKHLSIAPEVKPTWVQVEMKGEIVTMHMTDMDGNTATHVFDKKE